MPSDQKVFDDFTLLRKRQRRQFSLSSSVWAPRKLHGNSKDFFESDEAMRKMFEARALTLNLILTLPPTPTPTSALHLILILTQP